MGRWRGKKRNDKKKRMGTESEETLGQNRCQQRAKLTRWKHEKKVASATDVCEVMNVP